MAGAVFSGVGKRSLRDTVCQTAGCRDGIFLAAGFLAPRSPQQAKKGGRNRRKKGVPDNGGADGGLSRLFAAFVDRPWPGRYNKCVLTVREKDGERP